MKSLLKTIGISLFIISFGACKKDNNPPPKQPDYIDASQFFMEQTTSPQIFSGDAADGFTCEVKTPTNPIYSPATTENINPLYPGMIAFPPGSFINGEKEIVSGQVQVKIKWLSTNGNFLFSGYPTMTNEEILINSIAQMEIEASQNGERLQINPDLKEGIQITLPYKESEQETNFHLFTLTETETLDGSIQHRWVEQSTTKVIPSSGSISFELPTLGTINIGNYLRSQETQEAQLTIHLDQQNMTQLSEIKVALVWEGQNTILFGKLIRNKITFHIANAPKDHWAFITLLGKDAEGHLQVDQKQIKLNGKNSYVANPQVAARAKKAEITQTLNDPIPRIDVVAER